MAPAQVTGQRPDPRPALFPLGVILYELICGAAPFNGENVPALMYQIVNFVPPAPSSVNQAVPELLDYIVAKMIAKPIEERYADAAEVARDLRECGRQLAFAGAPINPATATHTQPLTPAAMPTLVDAAAKTSVLVQPVSRTREADRVIEVAAPAPAHGVAASFDSMEATQRLASLTGAAPPPTPTQAIKSMPPGPPGRRRRRDWLIVAGAGVCGLLAARSILRRR